MSIPMGCILIVTAPSGAGKSSLINGLIAQDASLTLSISYTTRAPRVGEINGREYHFVSIEEFKQRQAQGEFLEWAQVHGNYYATSSVWIMQQVQAGKDILLEVDWQGAQQIKERLPGSVGVFILPPSVSVLLERLQKRSQDSTDVIKRRMNAADSEIAHAREFDYVIINLDFSRALAELYAIVTAERCRFERQKKRNTAVFNELHISSE